MKLRVLGLLLLGIFVLLLGGCGMSPQVVEVLPAPGTQEVMLDARLIIFLDKPVTGSWLAEQISISPSLEGQWRYVSGEDVLSLYQGLHSGKDESIPAGAFVFESAELLGTDTTYQITVDSQRYKILSFLKQEVYTWEFSTVAQPQLGSVYPADGEKEVPVDSVIRIGFDRPMSLTSVAESLQFNPVVPGRWQSEGNQVIFVPAVPLRDGTTYHITLESGVRDIYGIKTTRDYTWSFSTQGEIDVGMPDLVHTISITGARERQILKPVDAKVDSEGFIYVLDESYVTGGTEIKVFDSEGRYIRKVAGNVGDSWSIAVAPDGTVYSAYGLNQVASYYPSGIPKDTVTLREYGQVVSKRSTQSLGIDARGNFYVLGEGYLWKFDSSGNLQWRYELEESDLYRLTVDRYGNSIVLNGKDVLIVDANGHELSNFSVNIENPSYLCVSDYISVYDVDTGEVRGYNYDGLELFIRELEKGIQSIARADGTGQYLVIKESGAIVRYIKGIQNEYLLPEERDSGLIRQELNAGPDFVYPIDVAASKDGRNIFIATDNAVVGWEQGTGIVWSTEIKGITGISLSLKQDSLYVLIDNSNKTEIVQLNTQTGEYISAFDIERNRFSEDGRLWLAQDIYVDELQHIWLVSAYGLERYDRYGRFLSLHSPDRFKEEGITQNRYLSLGADLLGNVYVLNAVSQEIVVFDPQGRERYSFDTRASSSGIGIDMHGNIFTFAEARLDAYSEYGDSLGSLTGWGRERFGYVSGQIHIWADRLYVVDTLNHRVVVFRISQS